jgi:hypothetical protein
MLLRFFNASRSHVIIADHIVNLKRLSEDIDVVDLNGATLPLDPAACHQSPPLDV